MMARTEKRIDPTMVRIAITYSGNDVRIVHVVADSGSANSAEHCANVLLSIVTQAHLLIHSFSKSLVRPESKFYTFNIFSFIYLSSTLKKLPVLGIRTSETLKCN